MSCAIRLVMAPDLNAVSRAAVSSTKSAVAQMGERGKLVTATVAAPWLRASRSASIVVEKRPRDPLLHRRQVRQQRADGDQDVGALDGLLLGARPRLATVHRDLRARPRRARRARCPRRRPA